MAAQQKPARVRKWRGAWYLFYRDRNGVERRKSCRSLGAHTPKQRTELVAKYREIEWRERCAAMMGTLTDIFTLSPTHPAPTPPQTATTAAVKAPEPRKPTDAFDTPLVDALDRYLREHIDAAVAIREANPKARHGMTHDAAISARKPVEWFRDWLHATGRASLTTDELDAATIRAWVAHEATVPTNRKAKPVDGSGGTKSAREMRSARTLHNYTKHLRAALRWLDALRPRMFSDLAGLAPAFRSSAPRPDHGTAHTPAELVAFWHAILADEARDRHDAPSTPISRLFLLLALTGCRLGEALALRWRDVDLERGRLTIHASKTGVTRIVPLMGAPEGIVAPGFVRLLAEWRASTSPTEFVLPHAPNSEPKLYRETWERIAKVASVHIGPQSLRRNWVSYAASVGVPASVAAMWAGHGVDVATRFYRLQVLDRHEGATLEAAMGFAEILAGTAHDARPIE